MNSAIVLHHAPVLLVGGGWVDGAALQGDLAAGLPPVAADSGAATLTALGALPIAVIGDIDSLPAEAAASIPSDRVHRIAEQDSTDFDKALSRIDAPLVIGHGFLGARLDHQLAAMTVLGLRADRRCLLVGAEDVAVLCPPALDLELPAGTRVSLWPLGPVSGRSEGLRWPIDGLPFAPDALIGTSNESTGPVRLWIDAPRMVLILPVACRNALEAALAATPEGWPARA